VTSDCRSEILERAGLDDVVALLPVCGWRLAFRAGGQEHLRDCPISFISFQEESMKLAALALASTFAVCSSLAQTVGGIAGGSSKAGSPAALSTTTSASISGGESHRKHKAYSELSGMRIAQAGAPSGRGSTTGDPAASSSNPDTSPTR
jgi:hypothetical protein